MTTPLPTKEGKSGYLLKKGEINKSWRVRWFMLQDEKLYYYKSPEQTKSIAYIPLDQAVVRISTENIGKEHCFEIVTKQRVYQLVAKSQTEMIEWMKTLSAHTILHAENALINQAEEMIAKATYDNYLLEEGKEIEELLNQSLAGKKSHILILMNNNNDNKDSSNDKDFSNIESDDDDD